MLRALWGGGQRWCCLTRSSDFVLRGKGSSVGNIVYFTFKNHTDCSEGTRSGMWLGMGNRRLKR